MFTSKKTLKLKYYRHVLTLLHVVADTLAVGLSFLLAYTLWNLIGPVLAFEMYEELALSRYALLFSISYVAIMAGLVMNKLYQPQRSLLNVKEFQEILKLWSVAMGVTLVVLFLADELYYSRGMFLITWILVLLFLLIERYGFYKFNLLLSRLGVMETKVIIYGSGFLGRQLLAKFRQSPKLGYHVVGFMEDDAAEVTQIAGLPILGGFPQLGSLIEDTGATKLFIALSKVSSQRVVQILDVCRSKGCQFQVIPSVYEMTQEKIKMNDLEGIPLISIREPSYHPRMKWLKRFFDLLFALVFAVVFLPFFLPVAVIHFFLLGGLFSTRDRMGLKGKVFKMLNLRGAPIPGRPERPIHESIFWIQLVCHSGLDRYPLLYNVLRGDMSLVGPFAESPAALENLTPLQRHKFKVRPGVTGLWEIAPKDEILFREDSDMDIFYLQNHSLLLDCVIMLRKMAQCIWSTLWIHQKRRA